ncbi:auxin-induced protein X10A-like [Senna tora]|uniref:Auxin-induced protein X10A-like n=1 Tax=Senna tora TaxID=362788 RepID=A0A834XA66_9FABA|nr:auxin-induced protein X10A-like [Senna tora]
MGIRVISGVFQQILRVGSKRKHEISGRSSKIGSNNNNDIVDVPKGHFAVAEEEYGFQHPMGILVIPCAIDDFVALTSHFNQS